MFLCEIQSSCLDTSVMLVFLLIFECIPVCLNYWDNHITELIKKHHQMELETCKHKGLAYHTQYACTYKYVHILSDSDYYVFP